MTAELTNRARCCFWKDFIYNIRTAWQPTTTHVWPKGVQRWWNGQIMRGNRSRALILTKEGFFYCGLWCGGGFFKFENWICSTCKHRHRWCNRFDCSVAFMSKRIGSSVVLLRMGQMWRRWDSPWCIMKDFARSPSGRCSICVLNSLPQLGMWLDNNCWMNRLYERAENIHERAAFHRQGYW